MKLGYKKMAKKVKYGLRWAMGDILIYKEKVWRRP